MSRIPRYVINLDLPPSQRWRSLVTTYKEKCLTAHHRIEKLIQSIPLGQTAQTIATWLVSASDYTNSVMHRDELASIAEILEQPFEKIVLAQLVYEMCACCTSAVFSYQETNTHFRTMDWGMDFLKDLTVELDFQKQQKTQFLAVSWVGYIGIMTGMLPNKYSIALNFRTSNYNILGNIQRAMTMCWPIGHLIRYILEDGMSCKMATETCCTASLISPCYITICSTDSCIITRDPDRLVSIKPLVSSAVQANVDDIDNIQTGGDILFSSQRCKIASTIIANKIPGCKTTDDIFEAFDRHPIINDLTIYSVIMIPQKGIFVSRLIK